MPVTSLAAWEKISLYFCPSEELVVAAVGVLERGPGEEVLLVEGLGGGGEAAVGYAGVDAFVVGGDVFDELLAASSLPSGIFLAMASPLPPYSPLMGVPSMVGRRATRNLPVAWGTPCRRLLAIHAPLMRLAMEPPPSDFIQSSVQLFVWTSMRSSSRIFCQRSMNRWAPLSW